MSTTLSVNHLSMSFDGHLILDDLSFCIQSGEIIALLGESGCGKSTLLRCIAGLEQRYKGEIKYEDSSVHRHEAFTGYIFQDYALFPHLSVEENIAFPLYKISKEKRQNKVDQLLEQFDIVRHRTKAIHELSGGQQQRVAIARALASNPSLLLLDEPFSNLDRFLKQKTKVWLKQKIKSLGLSAILVTHDSKEALSISDKIGIIQNNRLVQFDTPKALFTRPKNLYVAQFLGDINILPSSISQTLNMILSSSQVAIVRINKTGMTRETNDFPLRVINSAYCGDYYEIMVCCLGVEDQSTLLIRTPFFEQEAESVDYYLDIDPLDIVIIER